MTDKKLEKRRQEPGLLKELAALLLRIVMLAAVVWIVFTQVFCFVRNQGMEMFPAIKDGDLTLAFQWQQDYEKGDVILYRYGEEVRIGRMIAKETDVVAMDKNGNLMVNGTIQAGEIMYPTYAKEGSENPVTVPDGYVYILGDYRTQCVDSRDFGPISMEDIEGKVITLLRRRGL